RQQRRGRRPGLGLQGIRVFDGDTAIVASEPREHLGELARERLGRVEEALRKTTGLVAEAVPAHSLGDECRVVRHTVPLWYSNGLKPASSADIERIPQPLNSRISRAVRKRASYA